MPNLAETGREIREAICEQERGGHADEAETSMMLAINGELVQMDKAVEDYRETIPGTSGVAGVEKISMGRKVTTKSGVNGNATLATAAKGEKLLKAHAADIITFLEHFQRLPC